MGRSYSFAPFLVGSDWSDQSEPTKKRTSDQSDWSEVEEM